MKKQDDLKKLSKTELFILYLIECKGFNYSTTSRTTKYVVLEKEGIEEKFFIGKRGAIRVGRTSSKSRSVGNTSTKNIEKMINVINRARDKL